MVAFSSLSSYNNKSTPKGAFAVEERRLERPTPTSRTWCATNCATPRAMLTTDLH